LGRISIQGVVKVRLVQAKSLNQRKNSFQENPLENLIIDGRGVPLAHNRRRVVRVLAGDAAATLADQVLMFVLLQTLVLARDGAAFILAALMAADYLPGLALGPLCGAVLDRFGGRTWPLALNLTKALMALALALMIGLEAKPAALLVVYFLERSAGQAYLVSRLTLFPALVKESELLRLNALAARVSLIMRAIGPPLAGAVAGVWGPRPSLVLSAALLALAGLVLGPGPESPRAAITPAKTMALSGALKKGLAVLSRRTGLRRVFGLLTLIILGGGLVNFCAPLLAAERLAEAGPGIFWLGLMTGAFNLGSIAATFGVDRFKGVRSQGLIFRLSAGLCGPACLALIPAQGGPALAIGFLVFGLVSQPGLVILSTWVQGQAPVEARGRVLALASSLQAGGYLAASFIGAGLQSLSGLGLLLVLAGILMACAALPSPPALDK